MVEKLRREIYGQRSERKARLLDSHLARSNHASFIYIFNCGWDYLSHGGHCRFLYLYLDHRPGLG